MIETITTAGKRRGGRPKKYKTEEARKEARRIQNLESQRRWQSKQSGRKPSNYGANFRDHRRNPNLEIEALTKKAYASLIEGISWKDSAGRLVRMTPLSESEAWKWSPILAGLERDWLDSCNYYKNALMEIWREFKPDVRHNGALLVPASALVFA